MWIVSGPRSIVPDEGEGMEARKVKADRILPRLADGSALKENLKREFWGTAVPQ
jgi:hypothetical protein